MKIGAAAAASGCHIETIRYYERIGLLPRAARTDGGYRDYTADEVLRLRFITRGRELGFGLDEIRSLLALSDDATMSCAQVDELARHHLEEIKARVRELNRMAKELERTIKGCSGGKRAQCTILDALRAQEPGPGWARKATAHV
jgi:MerR family transcriptional regulator, mercuric resistance operon regulatory protein